MGISEVYLEIKNHMRDKIKERPFIDHIIELLERSDPDKLIFVSAPTGYGKTLISMSVAVNEHINGYKSIITYPLRSLIEDQKKKFEEIVKLMGMEEIIGCRYMGDKSSPYLIHPITLTTIDTLSLMALGVSPDDTKSIFKEIMGINYGSLGHYMFSWASVYTTTATVLDEVHLLYDSSKSLSFLAGLIKINEEFKNRLIFMSATIPEKFIDVLKRFSNNLIYEKFTKESDENFYNERIEKHYEIELMELNTQNKLEKIKEIIEKETFNTALIVFNTIEDAVNFYKLIVSNQNEPNERGKILIHSRFSIKDREEKIEKIRNALDQKERIIIVGTQAIEAGIDISSDLIISEIAPPNSLIQRFGRFLRKENERKGKAYIWYEENILNDENKKYKVYDKQLTINTLNYLKNHSNINLHINYDDFLNSIYKEEPEIKREIIDKMLEIMFNLTNPTESAIKFLLQLEGSLVRDGNIFIAVTEDNVKVPVNYSFLKERCIDCPKNERDAIIKSLKGEEFHIKGYYNKEIGII